MWIFRFPSHLTLLCGIPAALWILPPALAIGGEVLSIGGRLEPFVDLFLIESLETAELRLHPPTPREIVFTFDQPWEGPSSAYCTVLQDGNRYRLYYRGYCPDDLDAQQVSCMAESTDGIHFTRPRLRLYEFNGSKDNNIVWRGKEAHNFAPFLDANPHCPPDEKWKALGGLPPVAFVSADGIHWRKKQELPVLTEGAFDSLNIAFWDTEAGCYRSYSRSWTKGDFGGFRTIQSATSDDFLHWSKPVQNQYAAGIPIEHFYTNACVPYPRAPHIFLSFPKRFVPERKKIAEWEGSGVSDAVFMSSRDGVHWDRCFLEAWIRPGLDRRNWTHRNIMPAWGLLELNPEEYSLYHSEHYQWEDARLRRVTVRKDGFASLHAGAREGTVLTKPFRFEGTALRLNYSTSAAGHIRCEILEEAGEPLPGFSGDTAAVMFGDSLDELVVWPQGKDVASLQDRPIRLRISLRDADLFAIRFGAGE